MNCPLQALLCVALSIGTAQAAYLGLSHPYGELIDEGELTAQIWPYEGGQACPPQATVTRAGREVRITARLLPPGAPDQPCEAPNVSLGVLEAGWWTISLRYVQANGITVTESAPPQEVRVWKRGSTCSAFPDTGRVYATHRTLTSTEVVERLDDPAFAASLGGPVSGHTWIGQFWNYAVLTYPSLENPYEKAQALLESGAFAPVFASSNDQCFGGVPRGDQTGVMIEYHHPELDQYFYTTLSREVELLDAGTAIRGWSRTGEAWRVVVHTECPGATGQWPTYRFVGRPGVGPTSHVFLLDRAECKVVKDSGAWIYEGSTFWAGAPDARQTCTKPNDQPLYRIMRPFGEGRHRFATRRAVVEAMVAKGWIEEGLVMCLPPG